MHTSFKFYLSNEASNEFVPKRKVVGFRILDNFCIQSFLLFNLKFGEKLVKLSDSLFSLYSRYPLPFLCSCPSSRGRQRRSYHRQFHASPVQLVTAQVVPIHSRAKPKLASPFSFLRARARAPSLAQERCHCRH